MTYSNEQPAAFYGRKRHANESHESYDILSGSVIKQNEEVNRMHEDGKMMGVSETSLGSTPYATF
jgi:hypothetical protein